MEFNPDAHTLIYSGEAKSKKDILDILKDEKEVGSILIAKLDALATKTSGVVSKKAKVTPQKREQTKALLWQKYFDIRIFGAVLTAGTNAWQVRGPVQMTFARSYDAILPMDIPITRVAITKEADRKRKQTEIGRKAIVPYGLYMTRGFYNPYLATQTGVTSHDLEVFWEALEQMFTFDRSASRGLMHPPLLYPNVATCSRTMTTRQTRTLTNSLTSSKSPNSAAAPAASPNTKPIFKNRPKAPSPTSPASPSPA